MVVCTHVWDAGGGAAGVRGLVLEVTSPAWKSSPPSSFPLCCSKHKNGFYLCYRQLLSKAQSGSGHGSVSAEMQLQHLGLVLALPWL